MIKQVDKNLQRRLNFDTKRNFPTAKCLGHSRVTRFVTSILQSPIEKQLTSCLFLIFSSVLQQFLVIRSLQAVVKKSTLHRKIRLLIGMHPCSRPGNAS